MSSAAITQTGQPEQGMKELANFVSLIAKEWHDTPIGNFLHGWENVIFSWAIAAALIVVAFLGTRKICLIPGNLQNFLEAIVEMFVNLIMDILVAKGRKYIPFIGTLFLYILCQNLAGMIPGMKSPTSNLNTTVSLAVTVFIFVQWVGLKENGVIGYFDHLMGNPRDFIGWMLVPLNFPLHILQELIKPVSLSLRLFGNILGEDALIAAFIGLSLAASAVIHFPVGLPFQVPFMLLAILTGTIQAFVFTLLTTIYISLMLPHEHQH